VGSLAAERLDRTFGLGLVVLLGEFIEVLTGVLRLELIEVLTLERRRSCAARRVTA
jgi:hypothetical protein